ncbi:MAG: PilZ domain-containing protein [Candidatus Goldiibacteriota bacterium]|jgi:c-di-GMP-binding flagellar brake protein YcgR
MTDADLYIERRRNKRVDKKCKVKYKLINGEEETREIRMAAVKLSGESFDISLGGIRAEGPINARHGDIIRLEVTLDNRKDPITTFAEVKWIKGSDDVKTFGLEFLILKDADKALIEEILD